jgi:DNA-binding MarR family transcriptional regulator
MSVTPAMLGFLSICQVLIGDLTIATSEHVWMGVKHDRSDLFRDFRVDATAFLHEIVMVAARLKEARAFDGSPALHLDPRSRLLRAIERCGGAPTFSDLARSLGISRQTAREQALETARANLVELFQAPEDRRAWQVALTPAGRSCLEQQRMPQFAWLFTLLNGLEEAEMRRTAHVLRVIRLRLEGYARDQRGIGSPLSRAISPRTWR